MDRCLARRIDTTCSYSLISSGRSSEDEVTFALLDHVRQDALGCPPVGSHEDIDNVLEVFLEIHVLDVEEVPDSGIAIIDIDAPKGVNRSLNQIVYLLKVEDIGAHKQCFPAGSVDLIDDLLGFVSPSG